MEQCELERIKPIRDFLTDEKNSLLAERFGKIEGMIRDNVANIRGKLVDTLKELASDKDAGVLTISYLRSSYISGSHEFHIAHYTNEAFVEEEPDCVFFDMRVLFEAVEEDIHELNLKLEKGFIWLLPAEKEEVRRWYMDQLYCSFGAVMKKALKDVPGELGMSVYFGGFMDELEQVGEV